MKKRTVRGSATGRPIMALLDLLGRRWSLRIIWELRDDRSLTSRALRTACDEASPTVLQTRLSELREAGLVELVPATATASPGSARNCSNISCRCIVLPSGGANCRRALIKPPPPSGWRRRPARS